MSAANSVIAPIERGWDELNARIDSVGPHGLTMTGPDGWAVKDHVVHIAAWELSLLGLVEGADRRSAMGVPGADEETDAINAAGRALHSGKTPEQALAFFRETHAALMRQLGMLSDATCSVRITTTNRTTRATRVITGRLSTGWAATP